MNKKKFESNRRPYLQQYNQESSETEEYTASNEGIYENESSLETSEESNPERYKSRIRQGSEYHGRGRQSARAENINPATYQERDDSGAYRPTRKSAGTRKQRTPTETADVERSVMIDVIDPVLEAAALGALSSSTDEANDKTEKPTRKGFLKKLAAHGSRRFKLAEGKEYKRSAGMALSHESSRATSVAMPTLFPNERRLFHLVSKGSLESVRRLLNDTSDLRINCINFQGWTPLRIAVQNHDLEMVKLLLSQEDVDVGDCTLHAIRENQLDIAGLLLDHLRGMSPALEFAGVFNSSDFPYYLTPLLLAAQCGNYELVGMLMDRGHSISRPHPPQCTCENVCKKKTEQEDSLKWATERLDIYRAIANPAFLCQSSDDPILTAFQLYKELRNCATIYNAFRPAYLELAAAVREFPVCIIGCCRSAEEVKIMLRQRGGCDYFGNFQFPRLMLAIDYNQKEFVAHPNCQRVLDSAWAGDWYEWPRRSELRKILTVFSRMPMLPVITALCMFVPKSSRAAFYALPVNKMLSSIAAYLIFLVLVFCESNLDKKHQKRGPPRSGLEVVIVLFVFAHTWSLLRLCVLQGYRRFFRTYANSYEMLTQGLFCIAFIYWLWALIDVSLRNLEDLPRKYWNAYEPTLIAESFFTLATILAFGRLLLFLQFNSHIGPLQVAIGKMSKDFLKYCIIILITILAFAAGLGTFYEYYEGMIQESAATGSKTIQMPSFINFVATMKTLFWALFCLSPLESADVIIENLPGQKPGNSVINSHKFTQTVGYICLGMFEILSVIMLVNMLLASVCNTMMKVIDNTKVEWIYGKSVTYLNYMNQTMLPPPFNLIPTVSGMSSLLEWFRLRAKPKDGKQAKFSLTHCCYVEEEEEQQDVNKFLVLQAELVQRYFNTN